MPGTWGSDLSTEDWLQLPTKTKNNKQYNEQFITIKKGSYNKKTQLDSCSYCIHQKLGLSRKRLERKLQNVVLSETPKKDLAIQSFFFFSGRTLQSQLAKAEEACPATQSGQGKHPRHPISPTVTRSSNWNTPICWCWTFIFGLSLFLIKCRLNTQKLCCSLQHGLSWFVE